MASVFVFGHLPAACPARAGSAGASRSEGCGSGLGFRSCLAVMSCQLLYGRSGHSSTSNWTPSSSVMLELSMTRGAARLRTRRHRGQCGLDALDPSCYFLAGVIPIEEVKTLRRFVQYRSYLFRLPTRDLQVPHRCLIRPSLEVFCNYVVRIHAAACRLAVLCAPAKGGA